MIATLLVIAAALVAATVTGAIGYGFSSITVPVALTAFTSRVLNPALVLVEVVVNITSLVLNRRAVPRIAREALPLIGGLVPGVIVGSVLLDAISSGELKALTYAVLLPLIALQVANVRLPLRRGAWVGAPFGAGLGVLFATTTISGPPLALYFSNQGLAQDEFRAAVALVRVAESIFTLVAYAVLGCFAWSSLQLAGMMMPAVLIGMPIGRVLIRSITRDRFRRIAMTLDAVLVSVGLAMTLVQLDLASIAVIARVLAALAATTGLAVITMRRKVST